MRCLRLVGSIDGICDARGRHARDDSLDTYGDCAYWLSRPVEERIAATRLCVATLWQLPLMLNKDFKEFVTQFKLR